MNRELEILEAILKRHSPDPASINIANEIDHYFIFDAITDENDLDAAWSVFDENREIRRRLARIEGGACIVPGWGYRTPRKMNVTPRDDEIKVLVASHIAALRALMPKDEDSADIASFIDEGFAVEIAAPDVAMPGDQDNELACVLDEAQSDFLLAHFPFSRPQYEVLYNWAIYLTKCDEVAAYLLWPCLRHQAPVDLGAMDAGAELWLLGCRNRYWIKDADLQSKTVCVRPPWQEKSLLIATQYACVFI